MIVQPYRCLRRSWATSRKVSSIRRSSQERMYRMGYFARIKRLTSSWRFYGALVILTTIAYGIGLVKKTSAS